MRKMKDSGIDIIGFVPQKWECKRLKYFCTIETGNQDTQDADPDAEYPFYVRSPIVERSPTYTFDGEGILMAGDGAGAGRVFHHAYGRYAVHQRVYRIANYNGINSTFLFYYLSNLFDKQMDKGSAQSTVPSVRLPMLSNFPIFCSTTTDEQQKISSQLDRKCTEIDALTADIQKQIETLEEYRRSVITEAVTKGLNPAAEMKTSGVEWVGEIPAEWEIHPLYCYFGERKRINTLGKEDNLLSLSYGKVIQKDINALGGLLPESFNTYNIVEPNDIIIRPTDLQNDKRSLRTGLCTQYGIITAAYIALKPIVKLNSAFFHYLLYSFDVAKVFYNMGNGVRQGLNFGEFSKLTVFFPSLQEQDKIAAYLDRKCSEIDCIIKDKKQQLETLSEYKKSLIYEYVTGKKVVAAEITVSMVDPLLLLIAKILDNMPLNEGKIRVIKLALLSEYMYIPELETQYYRYKQGPYDVNIDKHLNEINKLGWFDISVDESPMKWKKGKKYNKFKQQSQQYDQYDDKITALINSIGHYKESHIGRIATLFSVWNDFIIEGIPNPSDEQIIQEVINNWTPNKAKTAKSVWQHTLDEMKTKGIIPHGKGLHTKKREENT